MINKYFVFTVVRNEYIETFANIKCMRSVSIPYFFVINVSNPSRLRLVVDKYDKKTFINANEQIYNYSYFIELLNTIYLSQEDPYIVNEFDSKEASQFEYTKKYIENNEQISDHIDLNTNERDNIINEEQMIDERFGNSFEENSQISLQKVNSENYF